MRLAVLASHEGTTLQSLIDLCRDEEANVAIAVVISNNSDSGALRRAREAGIPAVHLSSRTHPEEDVLDRAIVQTLSEHAVDLVAWAGYMKKIGPAILKAFEGRVISTHPGPSHPVRRQRHIRHERPQGRPGSRSERVGGNGVWSHRGLR